MTLAKLSYYAFDVGTIALAIAFVLFVVHTTLLAMGRRSTMTAAAAGAGGGTVTVTTSGGYEDRGTAAAIAQAFTWVAFVLFAVGLVVRAFLVGRGPWGNLYEFSIAFSFGIMLGYLYLGRRYPLRSVAFLPIGVAFFL